MTTVDDAGNVPPVTTPVGLCVGTDPKGIVERLVRYRERQARREHFMKLRLAGDRQDRRVTAALAWLQAGS